MTRGQLRVYLGSAPGVGKTYKMLEEGHRRLDRGTDVVVGFVEDYGRPLTAALVRGLEMVPRKVMVYRGATFTEMDVNAVLARRPQVALVDEMAHTNVPGSRNAKRWQDIQELLDAGITVLTTVNIQHLESLNDVVEQITGVAQRETVPDEVVRAAEQVELVDMTAEALRRRMAHGNIYPPEKIDASLRNYFKVGNLTALRELALLWLVNKVDEQLDRYRAEHRVRHTWEARERVAVALSGGPEGDTLIRRAARIAARTKGADLVAVHVTRSDGLVGADPAHLARQRVLVESLGGNYRQVVGNDVPTALLDFARAVNATQLVLGASRRGRFAQMFSRGVGVTVTALSGPIDVHLVTHEEVSKPRGLPKPGPAVGNRRRIAGLALAGAGLPLLTVLLTKMRDELSPPSDILAVLILVIAVAMVGGIYPALAAAIAGFLILNFYFTEPYHTFVISDAENVLALLAFLLVAAAVSAVVDLAARRTVQAARARAEAETLSTLAGSVLRGEQPLLALLQQVRDTFQLTSVTLLERSPESTSGPELQHDPKAWRVAAAVGEPSCTTPAAGDTDVAVPDDGISLVLRGEPLAADDRRVLEAFAAQAVVALRQQRLTEHAAAADALAEVDRLRTALLSAVGHDLRTPLASAKAAVNGLRSRDVDFDAADRGELLATVEESLDRLSRLVDNLLDMSRLQAGALGVATQPLSVAEAIPRAVDYLGPYADGVVIRVPDAVPDVHADPALLERILVNIIANAVRHSPPDQPPLVTASSHGNEVEVRVVDHGSGIPSEDWERVFLPFQRLGDRSNDTGVGLGLALSRGLAEAMGGSLAPEDTPGRGLTMVLSLPMSRPDRGSPVRPAKVDPEPAGDRGIDP